MTNLRILGLSALSAVGILFTVGVFAQQSQSGAHPSPEAQSSGTHVMLNTPELKWMAGPEGLPKGAKFTVLEGDPTKAGPFTLRAEFPANYVIKPHWHPVIEHVTVVSGVLYMGSGEKYDESVGKKLDPGGFAVMPIKYVHFAYTKGQKTTVQLHGMGPWGITYVNPADDPRKPPAK